MCEARGKVMGGYTALQIHRVSTFSGALTFCAFQSPCSRQHKSFSSFLFYFIILQVSLSFFKFSSEESRFKQEELNNNQRNEAEMKKKNSRSSRKKWKKPSFLFSDPWLLIKNDEKEEEGLDIRTEDKM